MPDAEGKYTPPPSGTLPAGGKKVLAAVYQKEREGGYGKERSAKIAWGAVRRAGYTDYYCRKCGHRHTPQDKERYRAHMGY